MQAVTRLLIGMLAKGKPSFNIGDGGYDVDKVLDAKPPLGDEL